MDIHALWTIYFGVAVAVFGGRAVARPIGYVVKPGMFSALDLAEAFLGIPALVGLWGYIQGKSYGPPWVWQVLLVAALAFAVRLFITRKFRQSAAELGPARAVAAYGSVLLLAAPMYVALALYAFPDGKPWR
jgi:hypothetical protein